MSHDSRKKKHASDAVSSPRFVDPMEVESSGQNDGEDVALQDDDEVETKVSGLSNAEVDHLRHLTLENINEMDKDVVYAVNSFFQNRIQDCEAALRARMPEDPLSATGAGLIAFIRCALSMEQGQADIALELLTRSSALAVQIMTNNKGTVSNTFSRMLQFRRSAKDSWLSPSEFRAKTIHAESQALRCFVLILQQSVSSIVKAGIALNKASSNYKSLYAELEQRYKEKYGSKAVSPDLAVSPMTSPNTFKERDASLEMSTALETLGVDRNSVHCVEFGLGAINLVVSLLPSQARSMLRFIGVEGNRQYGLRLLRQCLMSNTLLSPFASAVLLSLYGFLPTASAFLLKTYLPVAHEVRAEVFKAEIMRESLLHVWLDGRIERLTRNVELSVAKLERCLKVASNPQLLSTMPQLRDFVVYDQWFNYAVLHQWKRASRCLEVLSKTSKWANGFYQYTQASCLEMLEQERAAGISNAEGEVDFELEELRRIVGADKVKDLSITFCDISSREQMSRTIAELYWGAAQRKPVTLGGKPNHHDQFVAKRMEEILVLYGVDAGKYAAKKKLEDPLEPMPDDLRLRNTVPLPVYEMILLVGIAHQIPSKRKEQMLTRINSYLLKEPVEADTVLADYVDGMRRTPSEDTASSKGGDNASQKPERAASKQSAALPINYRVLSLCVCKALLLANSESQADREAASEVIQAVRDTPQYKDRQWTLSYAQAFVLYEKAYIAYQDESRDAAEAILNALHKQYDSAHYFMHAKIDFKAHLASYELMEQKQAEKAQRKAN
ncbi:hypothetical protein ABB37_03342 [Leptomonas pyrrhocoris]|uniref:Uncharacterized protein n=1 Tax=Leptomonas pyrrhocoris TaxID=157538 RepID=A0A0N0VG34_LEPPY|nr:hypothetical protein ABB37_03342 [Leptomonas pyrrhocoris]KPA82224.1 hypothetical protein ABB37_03342 [Leptomonas pyrrhocoris]|eukprot:XP_015660663.1 hypothetical protein ABB37_03342 [Leptomonas pyrrhocoris]